jgi:peptidoglycan hydrolase-like protein with peptidoglycan-binding domain
MAVIWAGAAAPLSAGAMQHAANLIGCKPAHIGALIDVEASGRFFMRDGTLPRRFEPASLPPRVRNAIGWTGSWRDAAALQMGARRAIFTAALQVDKAETLNATSWGGPQMMGFNATSLNFASAEDMVVRFAGAADVQLASMVQFLIGRGGAAAMRSENWLALATIYNGTGQAPAYAAKFVSAFARRSGRVSAEVVQFGSRGESVKALQRGLGIADDGAFGLETQTELREFQSRAGLRVDGVGGANTWAALRAAAPSSAPMPEPRPQESVRDRQLRQAGSAVAVVTGASGVTGGFLSMISSPVIRDTIIAGSFAAGAIGAGVYAWKRWAS